MSQNEQALIHWDSYANCMKLYRNIKGKENRDLQQQKLLLEIMLANLLEFIECMFGNQDSRTLAHDERLEKPTTKGEQNE